MLTLCLVLPGAVPAYAEEMNVPVKNAETSEAFTETTEVLVPEAVCAEAVEAEAVEAELTEDEAAGEDPKELAEKAEGTVLASDAAGTICVLISCEWNSRTYREVGTKAELSNILAALGISGSISGTPTSSDKNLFELAELSNEWTVIPVSTSETAGILSVTAGDSPYEIQVTIKALVKEDVTYVENGEEKSHECIIMTSADSYIFESTNWYAVTSDVTITNRITNGGKICLILTDGNTLTACKGIFNPESHDLTIYGQSEGTGTLIADASNMVNFAGIGGNDSENPNERIGGVVTINGGVVTAKAGDLAAAIGGGYKGESGNITINGGTVNAIGRGSGLGCGLFLGPDVPSEKNIGFCRIRNGTVNVSASYRKIGIDFPGDEYGYKIFISGHLLIFAGNSLAALSKIRFIGIEDKFPCFCIGNGTAYTVNHWRQKANTTGVYELLETETKTDCIAGLPTNAKAKVYPGFSTKPFKQQAVAEDGSTVIDIYYDRNRYTISFDMNGHGEAPAQITAEYEQTIYEPARPRDDGDYVFGGWFEEQECTTPFAFTTMPLNGKTLYAKWIYAPVKFYTITWRMDNGEIIDTTKVREGEMPLHKAAIKSGHLFAGWNPFVVPATVDTSYTAMFVEVPPDKLSVAFDTAGGSFIPPQFITKGQTVFKPADPVKDGYLFDGWYTDTGYGTLFDFGKTITKDTVIYARWTKAPGKKYEIRWMLNDITLIDTTEVTEGEMPVHGNPAIEGKIFIGWQPALAPVTGIAKYTAYFEERGTDKVAVTFNTDGGTFINTQVIDRNTTPVKPSDPQKKGYQFEGWYREPGFITPYYFDEPFNTDMILYAKWKVLPAVVYTVTWKLDDKTLINTTEVKEGDMPSHSSPSKEGYIFVGWEPSLAPVTSDITYTAKFEQRTPDKAAVTFNTDGGSFVETQVVTKGQKVQKPADPVKTGYSFINWYADAAFTTVYDFNAPVAGDITLFAKWKKNAGREYTITWKDWNGTVLATSKVVESGLPKYPGASKPSRSGYIFTGWTPEIDLAAADATYTATYEPKSSGGGGGGGGSAPAVKKAAVTFSPNWYSDIYGVWRIKNSKGEIVKNAWLCDDAVAANGQNVWYLLGADGAMLAAGLVQDATGNFYSLETNHDGYFGMLRYTDGYYNCNGQQVYLKFSHEHNGTFGAVINADGIEKLKAIYGVTKYGIGNENAVYTKTF